MRKVFAVIILSLIPIFGYCQNPYCPTATFGTYGVVPTPGQWALCLGSLQQSGAPVGSIGVGTTQISGGSSGYVLYDNAGSVGEQAFSTLINSWLNSLPTSLPGSSGIWWNNGGVLSKS